MKKIKVDLGFTDSDGIFFKLISAKEFSDISGIKYLSDEGILKHAVNMGFEVVDDNTSEIRFQYYAGQWFDCSKNEYERLNNLKTPFKEFVTRIIK